VGQLVQPRMVEENIKTYKTLALPLHYENKGVFCSLGLLAEHAVTF